MTGKAQLTWKFIIASLSLLAAIAVYSFARSNPPQLLESFQATNPTLVAQTAVFGSAPSFFYTLAVGLFIGACASTLTNARVHCLVWIVLAICLELAQHPMVAGHISTWLAAILSESSWELIGPYWIRGAFDPIDLVATLIGGLTAIFLITRLAMGENNADS